MDQARSLGVVLDELVREARALFRNGISILNNPSDALYEPYGGLYYARATLNF